ncbi:MAG TPA: hypothetical protein DDZ83_08850, partial [Nitrospinae bacterium]|nr:hypothetical protein [Nitrospinota bacterium]
SVSWSGGCAGGKLSGRGVFIGYENGKERGMSEGEMRNGKFHGRGIMTDAKGNRYERNFRDGKEHGR